MSLKLAISGARDFEDAQRRVSRELRDSGYSGTVIRRNSGKSRAALWHGTRHGHLALVKNGNRVSLHGCVEVPRAWRANPGQRVDVRLNGLRSDFVSGPDLVPRHGNPADLVLPRKAKQGDMVAGINVWLMPLGSVVMDPSTASDEVAVVNGVPNMYGLSVGEQDWLEADIYADGNKSFEVLAVGVSKDWDDPLKFAKAARKALEGRKAPSRGRRKGKAAPEAPTPARKAPKATSTAPKRSRGRPASVTHDDVLQALQRAGRGSATTIAKALGVTRDATGRALNALYADGRIERTVKGRGHTFWPLGEAPKAASRPKPKAAAGPEAQRQRVARDRDALVSMLKGEFPHDMVYAEPGTYGLTIESHPMQYDVKADLASNTYAFKGWIVRQRKGASGKFVKAKPHKGQAGVVADLKGRMSSKSKPKAAPKAKAAPVESDLARELRLQRGGAPRKPKPPAGKGPSAASMAADLEGILNPRRSNRGRRRRWNPVAYADLPADARSIIEDAARNDYGLSKAQATKLLGLLRDALLKLPESPPPAKLAGAVLKLMSKWSTEMKTAGAKASGPIKAAKGEISDEEAIQAIQSAVRKLLAA